MNKSIFERLGGERAPVALMCKPTEPAGETTYTQQGDYLLPDLKLPETEDSEIGVWG